MSEVGGGEQQGRQLQIDKLETKTSREYLSYRGKHKYIQLMCNIRGYFLHDTQALYALGFASEALLKKYIYINSYC